MIFKVFAVHDSKAEAFLTPFFMPTRAMAERLFHQMVNSEDHQFNKAPDDFTLFEIADYDDSDGDIKPHAAIESVANGRLIYEG